MQLKKQPLPIPKSDSWQMFNRISPRYDFLNHLLSFGMDISWRKQLRRHLPQRSNQTILDLATGTGDCLLALIQNNKNVQRGYGIDLAVKMLERGRDKITKAGLDGRIILQHGDAQQIPYSNNNFDAVTMAFGLRNVDNPRNVMIEIWRVLKPQGRALILEFSLPANSLLRAFHLFYLRTLVPLVGGIFSGNFKAYRYLNHTIEEFPYGTDFCRFMQRAGFKNVTAKTLLFGVATIYWGDK